MRKVLLATTALVAFAGAAQAAESPITINVGGYVDFRAALMSGVNTSSTSSHVGESARHGDFETEYRINMAAEGKAAHGIEYGAMVSLWNGKGYNSNTGADNAGGNQVREDQAYVWMSGNWGKVIFGDEHGASDLYTYAPTVGEGQIDGSYTNFTDQGQLRLMHPTYFDATENATKATYYTPKVGNANHKVQLGVSYTPNFTEQGEQTYLTNTQATANTYKNATEETVRYTGQFGSVGAVVAGIMATGEGNDTTLSTSMTGATKVRDYFGWGLGSQLTYAGFTLGGGYTNAGHLGTVSGQEKEQDVWTAGLKYEMDKVAVAVNGLQGRGYNNGFDIAGSTANMGSYDYVRDYRAVGFGATYTWFPGMTTAADVVVYDQKRDDLPNDKIAGNVMMLSQKLAF